MTWAALDDRLWGHPKVLKLMRMGAPGLEAFGIWAWSLSRARAYSSDEGRVDVDDAAGYWGFNVERMQDLFDRLVKVGLVDTIVDEDDPDRVIGFAIHDWREWQFTNQQRGGQARASAAKRVNGRFAAGTDAT